MDPTVMELDAAYQRAELRLPSVEFSVCWIVSQSRDGITIKWIKSEPIGSWDNPMGFRHSVIKSSFAADAVRRVVHLN
jgi:hypothetical protein